MAKVKGKFIKESDLNNMWNIFDKISSHLAMAYEELDGLEEVFDRLFEQDDVTKRI